ncbi:hypothetical protein PM082_005052 [Marasmius tenuissimus]|nr:hypothetical protein PM082_005052 [Marasmius tenuissimus]
MSAPRTGDWNRNSEPGSAFSGLGRGRRGDSRGGRGGARGGRGSRGGRGGGPPRTTSTSASTTKPPAEPAVKNDPPAESSKPADTSKLPSSTPEKPVNAQRPKPPSRKGSTARPIPTIITPTTSTETATSTSTVKNSSRPPNRRKRSQTNGKAGDNVPKIDIPPADDSRLRPQKGRGGKPSLPVPPHTAPLPKDTPPHLSANNPFDIRNNIDALVERVRAVAMDRPSTPGSHSHIDWAGDDDDSLPDLDDWGVNPSSTTSTSNNLSNPVVPAHDLISPIMIDGLRSLPDAGKHSPHSVATSVSPTLSHKDLGPEKPEVGNVEASSNAPQKSANEGLALKANNHRPPKHPLHPSLPAKPSFAEAAPAMSHWQGATPMRSPLHNKTQPRGSKPEEKSKFNANASESKPDGKETIPAPTQANKDAELAQPSEAPQPAKTNGEKTHQASDEIDELTEGKAGLQASQHAPKSTGDSDELVEGKAGLQASQHAPKPSLDDSPDSGAGLQASIHAPKALSESSIVPPALADRLSAPVNHSHVMGHNRAHTLGRPHALSPQGGPPSRFSRSGMATPRNGHLNHTRTHSTPPAGTSPHAYRAPHATRPVITGDAISKLARTIGGATMSPSRKSVALAPKE